MDCIVRISYAHLLIIALYSFHVYSTQYVKQQLETRYATSHLLTQRDAVTIGYGHFASLYILIRVLNS